MTGIIRGPGAARDDPVLSLYLDDIPRLILGNGLVPPRLTISSFSFVVVSDRFYRHQLIVIEFVRDENRIPKGRLQGKRIRFTETEPVLFYSKGERAVRLDVSPEFDTRPLAPVHR